jgi:D-serine deaminase-like pyridoxal phosphate-dependent protein
MGGIEAIDTPAVLIDLDILDRNIAAMAARARRAGVKLRPHTKTHKASWIAARQLEAGAAGITVAKLGEAEAMLSAGLGNLLVAYPILGDPKLERLKVAVDQAEALVVAVDDLSVAEGVARVGRELGRALPVYVEVDCGLGRMGRPPGAPSAELALQIARLDGIDVLGLMTHAGQAYQAPDRDALRGVAIHEAAALVETARLLEQQGLHLRELSIGSTPTAHFIEEVARALPVTEIRPGTYVFNDVNQMALGTAAESDCALTVLATVISRTSVDRMVIDAGSKTLGADAGVAPGYGRLKAHPDAVLQRLWEEHAVVAIDPSATWRVGDRVEVIPNHACIPPNLTDELIGTRAGSIARRITVEGRGKNR